MDAQHTKQQQAAPVDFMHPGVARDQLNHTSNVQELGDAPALIVAPGPIAED
ncbi:hypothetical protein HDU82_003620, partial [Entophlyctis luteolus]